MSKKSQITHIIVIGSVLLLSTLPVATFAADTSGLNSLLNAFQNDTYGYLSAVGKVFIGLVGAGALIWKIIEILSSFINKRTHEMGGKIFELFMIFAVVALGYYVAANLRTIF